MLPNKALLPGGEVDNKPASRRHLLIGYVAVWDSREDSPKRKAASHQQVQPRGQSLTPCSLEPGETPQIGGTLVKQTNKQK